MSLLLEVIEWVDPTGEEMIYRIPQSGSADFKLGAQLIVRDSQLAIFFKDGHAADIFKTGRHTLHTQNLPILTRLLAFPWGFTSPFRAEVYFVNLKVFTNLKWGTRDPVVFRDSQFGLIRLRGHGTFTFRIAQAGVFLDTLVGRQSVYTTANIHDYLRDVIIARLNDFLGERIRTVLDLPQEYTELAAQFKEIIRGEFEKYGLTLVDFYISTITPPDEVAKLIDERSGLEAVGDLDRFLKFQMAKGLGAQCGTASTGAGLAMGAGVGLMAPGYVANAFGATSPVRQPATVFCPECQVDLPAGAKYCYRCGHAMTGAIRICPSCHAEIAVDAQFCTQCGQKLSAKAHCPHCHAEVRSGAKFCSACGKAVNEPPNQPA